MNAPGIAVTNSTVRTGDAAVKTTANAKCNSPEVRSAIETGNVKAVMAKAAAKATAATETKGVVSMVVSTKDRAIPITAALTSVGMKDVGMKDAATAANAAMKARGASKGRAAMKVRVALKARVVTTKARGVTTK